jgi:uncharacterized protein
MRIAVVGATGRIGSRVVDEALGRGIEVTAVLRDPDRDLPTGVERRVAEATDVAALATAISGQDAVVSALGGAEVDQVSVVVTGAHALLEALPRAGVERLLVVGGGGSLRWPHRPEVDAIDIPGAVPKARRPFSLAQREALAAFRTTSAPVNWTYLSPADVIAPGERTGVYGIGRDHFVVDADGRSRISMEDYAVAVVDELERCDFPRTRFTVGYAGAAS